jgi:integrase
MRLHAHLFRHNFLTEKALDGENPSLVKRWAGHKKYEMRRIITLASPRIGWPPSNPGSRLSPGCNCRAEAAG